MPQSTLTLPLHRLAHGRTGDKGNISNISMIAYKPAYYPFLLEQVTVERVAELFRHRQPSTIRRYELPKLHALNFVLEDVLDGGVNQSRNLDSHGKTLAFLLLELLVVVPTVDVSEADGEGWLQRVVSYLCRLTV